MGKHTEEPWNVREWTGDEWPKSRVSVGPESIGRHGIGTAVAISPKYISRKQAAIDFRRIAACVNACADIPTEDLEKCCDNTDDWDRLELLSQIVNRHKILMVLG